MKSSAKMRRVCWGVILSCGLFCMLAAGHLPAYAQKLSAVGVPTVNPAGQDIPSLDAQRGAFDRFLDSHPEIANDVVADPTLLSNGGYLHEHPALQAFLESHPQVKADPRAFLSPREWRWRPEPPRSEWAEFLSDAPGLLAFVCFLLAVVWLLRSLWENRRWNRSLKMHEELQTKLMEKFASGQDFSTYMQSDAGRKLLEWTPPVLDTTPRGMPNPIARILWSFQAGLVLLLVGLGLLIIRGHMNASDASALLVLGTFGVTLGAGFILSALVSYGLSKRLGLIAETENGADVIVKH
jgi:hypothetical protein